MGLAKPMGLAQAEKSRKTQVKPRFLGKWVRSCVTCFEIQCNIRADLGARRLSARIYFEIGPLKYGEFDKSQGLKV